MWRSTMFSLFFFFNDTATTEIYTLSLHDALPISRPGGCPGALQCHLRLQGLSFVPAVVNGIEDRKSTRLNSSHVRISYAVFCLKKKKKTSTTTSMSASASSYSSPSLVTFTRWTII